MQLLDPSAIKRDPSKPHVIRSAEEGKNPIDNETLKMFERVQKIYDVVMLQEELKQVLNENQQYIKMIREMEIEHKLSLDAKATQYKKLQDAQQKKFSEKEKVSDEKVEKLTYQKEHAIELSTKNMRFQKGRINKLRDQIAKLESKVSEQKLLIERLERRTKLHDLEKERLSPVHTSPKRTIKPVDQATNSPAKSRSKSPVRQAVTEEKVRVNVRSVRPPRMPLVTSNAKLKIKNSAVVIR